MHDGGDGDVGGPLVFTDGIDEDGRKEMDTAVEESAKNLELGRGSYLRLLFGLEIEIGFLGFVFVVFVFL